MAGASGAAPSRGSRRLPPSLQQAPTICSCEKEALGTRCLFGHQLRRVVLPPLHADGIACATCDSSKLLWMLACHTKSCIVRFLAKRMTPVASGDRPDARHGLAPQFERLPRN